MDARGKLLLNSQHFDTQMCRFSTPSNFKIFCGHQLGDLQFNLILTLTTQSQHRSRKLRTQSQKLPSTSDTNHKYLDPHVFCERAIPCKGTPNAKGADKPKKKEDKSSLSEQCFTGELTVNSIVLGSHKKDKSLHCCYADPYGILHIPQGNGKFAPARQLKVTHQKRQEFYVHHSL